MTDANKNKWLIGTVAMLFCSIVVFAIFGCRPNAQPAPPPPRMEILLPVQVRDVTDNYRRLDALDSANHNSK